MLILNFTHPLTDEHRKQIEVLASTAIDEIYTIPVQIEQGEPLEAQVRSVVSTIALTSEEWQMRPLLINPPGYAPAAFVLLAEIHGRIGHFPSFIRVRPKPGPVTSYEVVELINLQAIRDNARHYR